MDELVLPGLLLAAILLLGLAAVVVIPVWLALAVTRRPASRSAALLLAGLVGLAVIEYELVKALLGIGYEGVCSTHWKFPDQAACGIDEWRRHILFPTPKENLLAGSIWQRRLAATVLHLTVFGGLLYWWNRRRLPLSRWLPERNGR